MEKCSISAERSLNMTCSSSLSLIPYKCIKELNSEQSTYAVCCHKKSSAERRTSLGKDWHAACLKCEKCNKTLTPDNHAERDGKPYCHEPCYAALFGPGGFGHGGTEGFRN